MVGVENDDDDHDDGENDDDRDDVYDDDAGDDVLLEYNDELPGVYWFHNDWGVDDGEEYWDATITWGLLGVCCHDNELAEGPYAGESRECEDGVAVLIVGEGVVWLNDNAKCWDEGLEGEDPSDEDRNLISSHWSGSDEDNCLWYEASGGEDIGMETGGVTDAPPLHCNVETEDDIAAGVDNDVAWAVIGPGMLPVCFVKLCKFTCDLVFCKGGATESLAGSVTSSLALSLKLCAVDVATDDAGSLESGTGNGAGAR